jgi:hypothetical protein
LVEYAEGPHCEKTDCAESPKARATSGTAAHERHWTIDVSWSRRPLPVVAFAASCRSNSATQFARSAALRMRRGLLLIVVSFIDAGLHVKPAPSLSAGPAPHHAVPAGVITVDCPPNATFFD